jgi:1,4-alpha-glucan branching enzyme
MSPPGSFCLVLHFHIPYVLGHSTWPHGSCMLYEAVADAYLPLLRVFQQLADEGVLPRVTLSLTPVLAEQLGDARFKEWFGYYLSERVEWAEANRAEFQARGDAHLAYLASRWAEHFRGLRHYFCVDLGRDLLAALRALQDQGAVELMTSAATHAYLPLLHEELSIQAQVRQGVQTYQRHFGRYPRGFWLPECAYRPRARWAPPAEIRPPNGHTWWRKGLHEFLAENGFDYFIVDAHLLAGSGDPVAVEIDRQFTLGKLWGRLTRRPEPPRPSGEKNPYFPYFVGEHFEEYPPVACLVRNAETSLQVWSHQWGYPGDGWYLEFHKKHLPGDHRYWRVTDARRDLASAEPYVPEAAQERARAHAGHFVWLVHELLEAQPRPAGRRPVLCAPFDAELFGHWWHEGPQWLYYVLRWMAEDPQVEAQTVSQYLADNPPATAISLPEGSWGAGGGHYMWLNEQTYWSWRLIHEAELEMVHLAQALPWREDQQLRAFLAQAGRELFLLQASDWQFLITTGTAPDYACQRLDAHYHDFKRVAELARRWSRREYLVEADWQFFGTLCERNALFPDLDPDWFAHLHHPLRPLDGAGS